MATIFKGLIYSTYIVLNLFLFFPSSNPRLRDSPLQETSMTGHLGGFRQYGHHPNLKMKRKKWDSVTLKQVGCVLISNHQTVYRNIYFSFCLLLYSCNMHSSVEIALTF